MSRLNLFRARLRKKGDSKPTVQVQTAGQLEVMTVTQEQRFRQLQRFRGEERQRAPSRAWYRLADACNRLGTTPDRLLHAAAAGRIACYVASEGLRGRWGARGRGDARAPAAAADVSHLRLTRAACREAAVHGGVAVTALRHPTARTEGAEFVLDQPLWLAAERILLKHPLPAPDTW